MNKDIIMFCPVDSRNMPHAKMMEQSLRKFHPESEIPLRFYDNPNPQDKMFWFRSKPIIAKQLFEEGYETVIGIDSDSIIAGNLLESWNGDFDVAVVNNSNPLEFNKYPYNYRNIHPLAYPNNGFVVLRSKEFAEQWFDLCNSIFFNGAQMKEQDMLADLVFSNHFKVKKLDEGDSYWGLAAKGWYPYCELINNEIILKKGKRDWPPEGDKKIKIIHFAGGQQSPDKGNYRIFFNDEIIKYLDNLLKPESKDG